MPRFPSIPRLSIVVPVGSDVAAFENSLVSVLENRPEGCEVIVPHDGSYDDPFDLGDEVRLIAADSDRLIDLIAEGAAAAHGRFVHVLAEGLCATEGWIAPALEKFEHQDAAAVAPVIRGVSGRIVAAGWHDTPARLAAAGGVGGGAVPRSAAAGIEGAYLQASFWRRDVIRSLAEAYSGRDTMEAAYAYGRLLRRAGWRIVLADRCDVTCEADRLGWDRPSLRRGSRLRAIRCVAASAPSGSPLVAAARALWGNLLRPSGWAEAWGQMHATSAIAEMRRRVRADEVARFEPEGEHVLRMPVASPATSRRRAAA